MIKVNLAACPGEARLRSYLAGRADEIESDQIEAHLCECDSCEKNLADLEQAVDSMVGRLRASKRDSQAPRDAGDLELEDALRASQELLVESNTNSSLVNSPVAWSPPGREIGPYDLIRSIGDGGMGSVFLAEHRELGKQVALKLLPGQISGDSHRVDRFLKEIRAAGSLEHPAIVNATDAGRNNGIHYLAMEYVEGLDLSRIARSGSVSVADACEAIRQVAVGLAHAHACGVVHRDVKPSNIMIRDDGEVKILDFGLAQISQWDSHYAELTTVGQLMGTLDYMSPEQADQPATVDYRADLYSLGATLFRLIGGRPPLAASPGLSPLAKLRLLANHCPPRLDTLRAELPKELVDLTAQLLATNPDDRPASASHVAEALHPFSQEADLGALVASAKSSVRMDDESAFVSFGTAAINPINEQPPQRTRWTGIFGFLALPLLLLAGYMISIETSKGHLVIESEVDGVSIELSSSATTTEEFEITQGVNSTRLKAGKYDVVLNAKSDGIQIDKQTIYVLRGETTIARIRRSAADQATADQATAEQTAAVDGARASIPTQQLMGSIRNSRTVHERRAQPAIPASNQPLQPGQKVRLVSVADKDLEMILTVMSDYTIKPRLVGVLPVKGKDLMDVEEQLNLLYRNWYESPEVELFLEVEEPLPGVAIGGPGPGVAQPGRTIGGSLGQFGAIKRREKPAVYQGQTLGEWLDIVRTERSNSRLLEATEAIIALAETKNQDAVVATLRENHDRIRTSSVLALLTQVVPPEQQAAFFQQQLEADDSSWRATILQASRSSKSLRPDVVRAISDWVLEKGLVPEADRKTIDAAFRFAQHQVFFNQPDAPWRDQLKDRLRVVSIGPEAFVSPFKWFLTYRSGIRDQWISRLVYDLSRDLIINQNTPDLELSAALATISQQVEIDLLLISHLQNDETLINAIGDRLASTDHRHWTNKITPSDPDFNDYHRRDAIDVTMILRRTNSILMQVYFEDTKSPIHSDPIVELVKLVRQLSLTERFNTQLSRIHEQTKAGVELVKQFLQTPTVQSVQIHFPTMSVQEVRWKSGAAGPTGNLLGKAPGPGDWFSVYIHVIIDEMLNGTNVSPVEQEAASR